jgi:uncharacterized protein YegJ (DUF2314 family)
MASPVSEEFTVIKFPKLHKKAPSQYCLKQQIRMPLQTELFLMAARPLDSDAFSSEGLAAILRGWLKTANIPEPVPSLCQEHMDLNLICVEPATAAMRAAASRILQVTENQYSPQELELCLNAEHIYYISSLGPHIFGGLWVAYAVGQALAARCQGVVIDPKQIKRLRDPFKFCFDDAIPLSSGFVTIPHSENDEMPTQLMTTIGLGRFGLPELHFSSVPQILLPIAGKIMTALAQLIIIRLYNTWGAKPDSEQITFCLSHVETIDPEYFDPEQAQLAKHHMASPKPGTVTNSIDVRLVHAASRQIPTGEKFLHIAAPEEVAETHTEWIFQLANRLHETENRIEMPDKDDDAMRVAHEDAMRTLPSAKERFTQNRLGNSQFFVKYPFPRDNSDQSEFMWVHVGKWQGGVLDGLLVNEPLYCSNLRLGQKVQLNEEFIFDWIISHADDTEEGGFTNQVLM